MAKLANRNKSRWYVEPVLCRLGHPPHLFVQQTVSCVRLDAVTRHWAFWFCSYFFHVRRAWFAGTYNSGPAVSQELLQTSKSEAQLNRPSNLHRLSRPHSLSFPLPVQLSIEEFLMNPNNPQDKDHKHMLNPLSAEFGVRTLEGLDSLIKDTLPDFKLVRASSSDCTWL